MFYKTHFRPVGMPRLSRTGVGHISDILISRRTGMDYEKVATDLLHAIEAALGFFRAENPHEAERILRSAVEELCHVEEQNPEDFCCGIS